MLAVWGSAEGTPTRVQPATQNGDGTDCGSIELEHGSGGGDSIDHDGNGVDIIDQGHGTFSDVVVEDGI